MKACPIRGVEAYLIAPTHDAVHTLGAPHGRLSAVICSDLDFPYLVCQAGRRDVEVLLGPSSDWAAIQMIHPRMAVTRAIKNGFKLVRPAHTGLSVVADPFGCTLGRPIIQL